MESSFKKLLFIGLMGFFVTWGTFIARDFSFGRDGIEGQTGDKPITANERPFSGAKTKKPEPETGNIPTTRALHEVIEKRASSGKTGTKQLPAEQNSEANPFPPNPQGTINRQFVKTEKTFETEPRDSLWADKKERTITGIFEKGEIQDILLGIKCRSTLCRMEIRFSAPDQFMKMLKLPGIDKEMKDLAALNTTRSKEATRMTSIFYRDGYSPKDLKTNQ